MRADARRNRARVLDVAEEVFATDGIAVPIDEVARRAGVGVGTVYRHFPTKEALFEAIVLQRVERLTTAARAAVTVPDPVAAFFDFFTTMIEAGSVNKALFDGLADAVDREAVLAASRDFQAALAELLSRAQRAGGVRPDLDPADLKALMVGTLAMERNNPTTPGRMIDIVLRGLRP